MKRHEALAPLSRAHHHALILARLIKRNAPLYKSLPSTTTDKMAYALQFYESQLKMHFKKEELLFEKVKAINPDINQLVCELLNEHQQLALFFKTMDEVSDGDAALNELGNELEAHIRKEERIFFPLLQQFCTNDQLLELQPLLA